MNLVYRGVSYDYTPPEVETVEAETSGTYRGLEWRFRNPKKSPVMSSTLDLRYRGVAYQTAPEPQAAPAPVEVAPVAAPALTAHEQARGLMMGHHRLIKNRQQSLLSRSAKEIGLVDNISGYWNHIQGKVHPTFRVNYDRSHASLS